MAYDAQGIDLTFNVAADFSTSQYACVSVATSADNLIKFPSTAGAPVIGVIQDPASSGSARVRISGVSKVLCTSCAGVGDIVAATTLGRADGVTTAVAESRLGTLIAAASTGNTNPQIGTIVIQHLVKST